MHDRLPRAELRFLFSPAALLGLLFIGLLTAAGIAMFAVPPVQWNFTIVLQVDDVLPRSVWQQPRIQGHDESRQPVCQI